MPVIRFLLLFTITLFADNAFAKVITAQSDYFKLEIETTLTSRNQIAYSRFLKAHQWWHSDHTYFGDAKNLRIESSAGGCFCERASNRSVEHMRVIFADPGFVMKMRGGLGPLQDLAVEGVMTWRFEGKGELTQLTLVYEVWGANQASLNNIAAPVDQVLTMQLERLRRFVDTGSPEKTE